MKRAPRVLLLGSVLAQPPGGVRRHAAELLPRAGRLLCARGGRLCVLEGKRKLDYELPPEVERLASELPAGPPLVRGLLEGRLLRRLLRSAREAGAPYDLVHTGHFPVPRHLAAPLTVTIHDLRALELAHTPFSRRLIASHVIGSALRAAARVFTVSETVRASIRERFGIAGERITVVPNAGDHYEPLPRAPRADARLLHLGHVEPRKNLGLLVRALAADPGLPDLTLAGAGKGDEEARLRGLATKLGVAERVHFLGRFEEGRLPNLYAEAACVVLPSHVEGFGIAVLEAQRAGCPLAVSATGALPEVAGERTPRFEVDDAPGCARAIHAALAQDAAELEAARTRAERYSWDASAELLVRGWCEGAEGYSPVSS